MMSSLNLDRAANKRMKIAKLANGRGGALNRDKLQATVKTHII